MAETHGRFDGMDPAAAYTLITNNDGNFTPPADPLNPNAHFDAAATVLSQELVTLPYLPDPIARGASLTFFDRKRKQIGSVRLVDFYSGGAAWPKPVSFRLRLVEGTGEPTWEKDGSRVLTVYVPKAERIIMRYTCTVPADLLAQQADMEVGGREESGESPRAAEHSRGGKALDAHAVPRGRLRPSGAATAGGTEDREALGVEGARTRRLRVSGRADVVSWTEHRPCGSPCGVAGAG